MLSSSCKNALVSSHINFALYKKNSSGTIPLTKKTLMLVKLLRQCGVVKTFVVVRTALKQRRVVSYQIKFTVLFYKNTPFFGKIRLVSTPARKHYITYDALRLAVKYLKSSLVIVSTSRGVISHNEAIRYRIGGVILYVVS